MHGGGQGATLLCGMRMGDHEAKAAQDQTFARPYAMVIEFLHI